MEAEESHDQIYPPAPGARSRSTWPLDTDNSDRHRRSMMEPHQIDVSECRRLLESGVFGRVAISTPSGPLIVPVNYAVSGDRILFRTTPYSVLGTYGRNAEMAFEVDHVDYEYEAGWSVVALGRGNVLTDAREVDRKSTRLNSSHPSIYTLSLHDALPIYPAARSSSR